MDKKGHIVKLDGKPIAGYCKRCGEFTLDTKTMLCASCSIVAAIMDIAKTIDRLEKERREKEEGGE